MEKVFTWLRLPNYDTLVFDPRFIAGLFAGCIIWCAWLLYRRERRICPTPQSMPTGQSGFSG